MEDTYEGDFVQRRAIIYTLDFETRIRFYGPVSNKAIIKVSDVNLLTNQNDKIDVNINTILGSIEDTPDDYTIVQTITDFGFNEPNP
jgi:hypothetical protein